MNGFLRLLAGGVALLVLAACVIPPCRNRFRYNELPLAVVMAWQRRLPGDRVRSDYD